MSIVLAPKTKWSMIPLSCSLCLCISIMTFPAYAAEVNFTANFETPTCEVSAPAALDFGDISSQKIKQGISIANPQSLTITLSSCSGWITATQRPGVKVSGTGNTNSGDFLFMLPATSTVVNYGFLLTRTLNNIKIANNTFIPIADEVGSLPSEQTTIGLNVALSCGTKCSSPTTSGGALNAAITFSFAYE